VDENELSHEIIGAAIEVHKELGPGIFESTYEECLAFELQMRGIPFERQIVLPVIYKGNRFPNGYRVDLWVDNLVIVELKSVENMTPLFFKQLRSYLQLSGCKLGLLINFNVEQLRMGGIKRIANKL
jgi:GxxExxY protein